MYVSVFTSTAWKFICTVFSTGYVRASGHLNAYHDKIQLKQLCFQQPSISLYIWPYVSPKSLIRLYNLKSFLITHRQPFNLNLFSFVGITFLKIRILEMLNHDGRCTSIQYSSNKCHINKWASAWDFQQCGMCDQQSLRSACAYAPSDQSPC